MKNINVTFFSSSTSRDDKIIPLSQVLSDFRTGRYAEAIENVRQVLVEEGPIAYSTAKKNLPAIAFCGEFSGGHAKSNIVKYNDLMIIDIDHISSDDMLRVRECLMSDEYVFSFWRSPSGLGYKGLIHIKYINETQSFTLDQKHKAAFNIIYKYLLDSYDIKLDLSGSDYSRICYVGYDDKLVFKERYESIIIDCQTIKLTNYLHKKCSTSEINNKNTGKLYKIYNVKGKNDRRSRDIIVSIIKYLSKRNLSITSTYDEWLRVGFAIATTFNYDIGQKYFIELSKLDPDKYNEDKCIEKLIECYKTGNGSVTIATIIDMACAKGYIHKGSSED